MPRRNPPDNQVLHGHSPLVTFLSWPTYDSPPNSTVILPCHTQTPTPSSTPPASPTTSQANPPSSPARAAASAPPSPSPAPTSSSSPSPSTSSPPPSTPRSSPSAAPSPPRRPPPPLHPPRRRPRPRPRPPRGRAHRHPRQQRRRVVRTYLCWDAVHDRPTARPRRHAVLRFHECLELARDCGARAGCGRLRCSSQGMWRRGGFGAGGG